MGPVKWTYFYLYVIIDIFSRRVVGWCVADRESATLFKALFDDAVASIAQSGLVELVGPGVNDGIAVEIIHGGHEAILEFLLGGDANVPQDGTGEFREEALDEIEFKSRDWG